MIIILVSFFSDNLVVTMFPEAAKATKFGEGGSKKRANKKCEILCK